MKITSVLFLTLFIKLLSINAFAQTWGIPVPVDIPRTSANAGQYTSMKIVNGNPAIAYYDTVNKDLIYVRALNPAGTAWGTPISVVATLDYIGEYNSLQIVNGYPAISYFKVGNSSLNFVRALDSSGTTWGSPVQIRPNAGPGQISFMEIVNGNPAIAYCSYPYLHMKFIRANDPIGSTWGTPLVLDSFAHNPSLKVIEGKPAICFGKYRNPILGTGVLSYMRATDSSGTSWDTLVKIDSTISVGYSYSYDMNIVNGMPAITYFDKAGLDLKYVRAADPLGAAWASPVFIDTIGNVGQHNDLQIINANPAISYYDRTKGDLKYVRSSDVNGSSWPTPVIVDSSQVTGKYASMVSMGTSAAIAYYNVTQKMPLFVGPCTDPTIPVVSTSPLTICSGGTSTLSIVSGTLNSATAWQWYSGSCGGTPVGTGVTISVSPTSTTTYYARGEGGCVLPVGACGTITVNVNALPTVNANASATTVCPGTSVSLTGSGNAVSYSWSHGVTNGVGFIPTVTTTYTVTGTSAAGCVNTNTITIQVNSLPNVNANASSSTICVGGSVTLTGSGSAVSYSWSHGVTNAVGFIPSATNTYTVIGVDAIGCANTATVTVSLHPIVNANASSMAVCAGGSLTLTGSGTATSYAWSHGVTNGIGFIPSSTSTYTVTGTAGSCINKATVTVNVNALPSVNANASSTTICTGAPVTLTGSGTATSYTWSHGVINGTGFVPASTSTYTVTGTNANGCVNTSSVTVNVNSLPTVNANASSTTVCAGTGTSVTLTGSGNAVSYTWSHGVTDGTGFVPTTTNTYTVTGTDAIGCANKATITVTLYPIVNANASTTNICAGSGGSVILTASGTAASYSWSHGVTDGVGFVPTATATYTVTGTAGGCTNFATVAVILYRPNVYANASSTNVCAGSSVTLTATGADTYVWSHGITGGVGFVPTASTTYTVSGTDANSCSNTATVTISVNQLPAVTPHTSANNICAGTVITLTGSGTAVTYTWSGGVVNGQGFAPAVSAVYTVTGTSSAGCIKMSTISIIVKPAPGMGTSLNGPVITALQTGAVYQWLNCDSAYAAIAGATGKSYTATANGQYAVRVSLANGCADTSACVDVIISGIGKNVNDKILSIYPNPNAGSFTIEDTEKGFYSIINELGQTIKIVEFNDANNYKMNVENLNNGIYFIIGYDNDQLIKQKVVVTK